MSIFVDEASKAFWLNGKGVTYAFFINQYGYAEHLYYGATVGLDDLTYTRAGGMTSTSATPPGTDDRTALNTYQMFAPELAFFGTGDYREPAVQVQNAPGDRLSELLYDHYEILPAKPAIAGMPSMTGGETLAVWLRDPVTNFGATLYYTVYDDADVIARHVVYRNGGTEPVTLRRAYSFSFGLPGGDYEMLSLYGGWARERQPERVKLHHGVTSIDSKRTASSHTLNPFIAVMAPDATETAGEVYGFSLVYSSSYVLKAEVAASGETVVTGGINDFDFGWQLGAGEEFAAPEVIIAYSAAGLGGMSRAYHDAFRDHLINPRYAHAQRPLLINNWEGTYFSFDNAKLMAIVDAVEGTGIDTFVLDDGWFGVRNDDTSGLGDWVVNTDKMQGGLRPVIDHVHAKGMKFGLWFEPEMVNENSDLFRAHPDYAIQVPGRGHCYSRHQLMLDLTRADVRDEIVRAVNRVLDENPIDYVKWDYNRNVTESFSIGRSAAQQTEFAHRYALGLYDLCERIVEAHPNIFFEGCSGGGGRFDPAMLHYFPQIWTSDDTDAEERTHIQYSTSIVYPLSAMSCHVSVCPNHQTGRTTPMATRAAIAQLGATGYELDTTAFSAEDIAAVQEQTAEYRHNAQLILDGDLYRIDDPYRTNFFTEAIVAKDKRRAVMVSYRRMGRPNAEAKRVRMQGLDPAKRYCVPELGRTLLGATLMQVGVPMNYPGGDFGAVTLHFDAVEE